MKVGGRYWTRTSDPRRVKAMLYQLSQAPNRAARPAYRRTPAGTKGSAFFNSASIASRIFA